MKVNKKLTNDKKRKNKKRKKKKETRTQRIVSEKQRKRIMSVKNKVQNKFT